MARGERNGSSVLTANDVRDIRAMLPTTSCRAIARRYGVSKGTITAIANGVTWRHIT